MRDDLFDWKDEQEASADVEAAHQARAQAGRKYRCAPHGEIRARHEALVSATAEALRAELNLAKVKGSAH
jgi:hypothetical protein